MTPAELYNRIGLGRPVEIAVDSARGFRLCASADPGEAFRQQIESTLFGSSGVRIRRLDVDRQLSLLPCPIAVELTREDRLIGTYVLTLAPVVAAGQEALGVYRSMLTVRDDESGQGLGRWMAGQAIDWIASRTATIGVPVLSWGCIDQTNARSLRVLERLGAMHLGDLVSMLVYRQWPGAQIDIEQTNEGAVLDGSSVSLADCASRSGMATPGTHYRVRGDELLPAAATANEMRLEMAASGDVWDGLYRRMVKYVPPARRRFDPANFRYLRLSDLTVTEKNARQWPAFITSLLARHRMHMAMLVLDPGSTQYRLLEDAGVFGRFGRATRQRIEVLGQAWHCDPDFLETIAASPVGIGPLDV